MGRKRRVVVTGLGVVASNGIGKEEFQHFSLKLKCCIRLEQV